MSEEKSHEIFVATDNEPILIIGAGLGGLALAHALRSHNVSFQLFERDRGPMSRAQGYRIRIQDYYLKQLLPAAMWTNFENCCAEVGSGMSSLDALTGEAPAAQKGRQGNPPKPVMSQGTSMNADRRVLRNLMLAPLIADGLVQFGKRFCNYDADERGVTAHFKDGTQARGRLLIGADGSRSLVRQQLIPDFRLLDTQGRAIFGKTPFQGDPYALFPKEIASGLCLVFGEHGDGAPLKLFSDTMCFTKRANTGDELPSDYIYWVLSMRADKTGMEDEEFLNLSREFAYKKSLDLSAKWHPKMKTIMLRQDVSNTATLAFATSHPDLPAWEANQRVTLLGDAAHPMTPVGGVGANAAFQDATLLLHAILTGGSLDDIATYEDAMRQNARTYIAASIKGAGNMFGMPSVEQLKPWSLW